MTFHYIRILGRFAVANVLMKINDITTDFIVLERYIIILITRQCTVEKLHVFTPHHRTNERTDESNNEEKM